MFPKDSGTNQRRIWARFHREIEELVSMPNLIGEIKSTRYCWLGHVDRMGKDQATKAYLRQPTGDPRMGHSKYWLQGCCHQR